MVAHERTVTVLFTDIEGNTTFGTKNKGRHGGPWIHGQITGRPIRAHGITRHYSCLQI